MKNLLGTFPVVSGQLRVSDPCYEKSIWCSGVITNALKGTWEAFVRLNKEGVVSSLEVANPAAKAATGWREQAFTAGVDSGQMCVFDEQFYRQDFDDNQITPSWRKMKKDKWEQEKDSGGPFYATACSLTCGENNGTEKQGGVWGHGAVSSSGYGDGSYRAFAKKDAQGKVVAVKVKFI